MGGEAIMNPAAKKLKVVVDNVEYTVEVGDLEQSPVSVTVNGKAYKVAWETLDDPGVEVRGAPRPAAPAAPAPSAAPPSAPAAVSAAADEVIAPMPGTILEIVVKAGDRVESGQTLCYLEAMKMKNAIRSPRAGTIASVDAQEGQTVAYGTLLFRFSD
jgi:biotin carboxyl carrier protein